MTHKHRRKNGVTFACDCDDGERLAAELEAARDDYEVAQHARGNLRDRNASLEAELSAARAERDHFKAQLAHFWVRLRALTDDMETIPAPETRATPSAGGPQT